MKVYIAHAAPPLQHQENATAFVHILNHGIFENKTMKMKKKNVHLQVLLRPMHVAQNDKQPPQMD